MKKLFIIALLVSACDQQGTRGAPEPREPAIPDANRCCLPDLTHCQNIDVGAKECAEPRVEASCSGVWTISPASMLGETGKIVYLCDGVAREEG